MPLRFLFLFLLLCAAEPGFTQNLPAVAASTATLDLVASFPVKQVTGVAVSRRGRVFVNFPDWSDDHTISVAEIVNGQAQPYPNQ